MRYIILFKIFNCCWPYFWSSGFAFYSNYCNFEYIGGSKKVTNFKL